MALAATLDSLDDVPEEIAEHYEQDGDIYRLRVDGYEDVGLRTTLEDKKRDIKKLRDKLKAYEGIDPDEVAELRNLREEYEDKIASAGKWEDQKARLEEKHNKALEGLKAQLDTRTGQLSTMMKRDAASAALRESGALVDALLPHVLDRVTLVEDDGQFRAVATGLDGETETTIEGLVGEMKSSGERFAWGFAASGNSGAGGAAGSGGGSANHGIRSKKDLAGTAEKSQYIATHGLQAFQALPNE